MMPDPAPFDRLNRHQAAVIAVGFGLGFGITVYHYVGLVVGGLVLGLGARSVRRAILTGIALGLTVWIVFGASLFQTGNLARYTAMGDPFLLSGAIAIGLPTLAATVRGLR